MPQPELGADHDIDRRTKRAFAPGPELGKLLRATVPGLRHRGGVRRSAAMKPAYLPAGPIGIWDFQDEDQAPIVHVGVNLPRRDQKSA
jgi:hypothetical protein